MTARTLTLQHVALYAAMLYTADTEDSGDFGHDCRVDQLDARFDLLDPDAPLIMPSLIEDLIAFDLIDSMDGGWRIEPDNPLKEQIAVAVGLRERMAYKRIRWLFDLAFPRESMPLYEMLQDIPAFVSGPISSDPPVIGPYAEAKRQAPSPEDDEPKRLIEVVSHPPRTFIADPEYRHDPLS